MAAERNLRPPCLEAILAEEDQEPGLQDLVFRAESEFKTQFGKKSPELFSAGASRVEVVGNFTDQGYGLCALGFPTQLKVVGAFARRADRMVRIWTGLYPKQEPVFINLDSPDLDNQQRPESERWTNYQRAILNQLKANLQEAFDNLTGADIVLVSNIPPGSGISSSAAVEATFTHGFLGINRFEINARDIALLTKLAENEAGSGCGHLDQGVSNAHLETGYGALLRFKETENGYPYSVEPVYADLSAHGACLVLAYDASLQRKLAEIDYPRKAGLIQKGSQRLADLLEKDVLELTFADVKDNYRPLVLNTDEETAKLVWHVLSEDERVRQAACLLNRLKETHGKEEERRLLKNLGRIIDDCAQSSIENYGVADGVPTLRVLLGIMRRTGAYGARNTGGGGVPTSIMLSPLHRADEIISKVADSVNVSCPGSNFRFVKLKLGKPSRVLNLQR
jgi:galactokinase